MLVHNVINSAVAGKKTSPVDIVFVIIFLKQATVKQLKRQKINVTRLTKVGHMMCS